MRISIGNLLSMFISLTLSKDVASYVQLHDEQAKMGVLSIHQDRQTIVNDRSVKYAVLEAGNPLDPFVFCNFWMKLVQKNEPKTIPQWTNHNDTVVLEFEVETTYLHHQAHPSVLPRPLSRITSNRPGWTIEQEITNDYNGMNDMDEQDSMKLSFRFEIGVREQALLLDYTNGMMMHHPGQFISELWHKPMIDIQVVDLPSHATTLHELASSMTTVILYVYEGELMSINDQSDWYMQGTILRLDNIKDCYGFESPCYLHMKTGGIGARALILSAEEIIPPPSTAFNNFPPTSSQWSDYTALDQM